MDLTRELHGSFDVVLFAGVFYHLKDPIRGLEIAASLADEVLIVETQIDLQYVDRPAMAHYPSSELGGDKSNWWAPNIPCMIAMLRDVGFKRIETGQVVANRCIFHAWRSDRLRIETPREMIDGLRRAKLRAARRLFLEALGLRAGERQ